jgi:hypothetical protein
VPGRWRRDPRCQEQRMGPLARVKMTAYDTSGRCSNCCRATAWTCA